MIYYSGSVLSFFFSFWNSIIQDSWMYSVTANMIRNTVEHAFRSSISDHKSVSTFREVHLNLISEMLHWVCWLFWLCTLWRRKNWIIILCSRKYWNMYLTCNPTRNIPSIQSVFQIVLIKAAKAVWWNEFCLTYFIWSQDFCTINLTSIGKPLSADVNDLVRIVHQFKFSNAIIHSSRIIS